MSSCHWSLFRGLVLPRASPPVHVYVFLRRLQSLRCTALHAHRSSTIHPDPIPIQSRTPSVINAHEKLQTLSLPSALRWSVLLALGSNGQTSLISRFLGSCISTFPFVVGLDLSRVAFPEEKRTELCPNRRIIPMLA